MTSLPTQDPAPSVSELGPSELGPSELGPAEPGPSGHAPEEAAARWVLDYPAACAAGAGRVGGKAHTLARLSRYGFPVPVGFALDAAAYRAALGAPELAAAVAALRDVPAEAAAGAEARAALERVRALLAGAPLGVALEQDLAAALDRLGPGPVAVRSSALAEDGRAASFAGVHESSLGVRGAEELAAAVRACWASLWTPSALAYRRRLGIADEEVACAVLVCSMVGGEQGPLAAGVAFGCDPITGQRGCVVLEAGVGLGDALVRGEVTPERWRVDLRADAPEPQRVAGAAGARPLLEPAQALALARLVRRVEWALGDGEAPHDVEWALADGEPWLVQARPVTACPRPAAPGLEGRPVLWSDANVSDAAPGVLSPLGWSLLKGMFEAIFFAGLRLTGYRPPAGLELTRRFQGRIRVDVGLWQWVFFDVLGVGAEELQRVVGGHQPALPEARGSGLGGWRGLARLWRLLRLARGSRRALRGYAQACAEAHATAARRRALPLEGLDRAQLRALIQASLAEARALGRLYMIAGGDAAFLPLLNLLERRLGAEGCGVAAGLLAGSGALPSAQHAVRLHDLGRAAREDPAARALLEAERLAAWQDLPEESPFRHAFANFLAEHGHRGVYEGDLRNPRWREDCAPLLHEVAWHARADAPDPRRLAASARARAEARLAELPWLLRRLARALAASAREGAARREQGKSAFVAIVEPTRRFILRAGQLLADEGLLDAPPDVFELTHDDLDAWLSGAWDGQGARELVADRRARDAAWRAQEVPQVLVCDAAGLPLADGERALGSSAGVPPKLVGAGVPPGALRGLGASGGRVTAVARALASPAEGERLGAGEVLVAHTTDPGWTPLFLRASAVVTEVGGLLSHGAIVARELGVPAVVNVPGALRALRDGERVTVDGGLGAVWPETAS
ncbi:MAG: PEP/pyruvate-binding domain-containing protein [Planctomycetota bacterium]